MPRKKTTSMPRLRPVVPDKLDLRDRQYQPEVREAPPPRFHSVGRAKLSVPVLDQGDTNACTGFALANVVHLLLRRRSRRDRTEVSPFMLYSMARRYDEFPGASADAGSSLRGAMKGWYRHGACARRLWTDLEMPKPQSDPRRDWWQNAAERPLGAYYRVDTRSVTDMHVALHEVGVLYASAICHSGWDEGLDLPARKRHEWRIPLRSASLDDGGHAFVIVGYDEVGFLVLNSWGESWGDDGYATLTYEDWTEHAMDCWVAQLGVVTEQRREMARSRSLRRGPTGKVVVASEPVLQYREISPFVVDMENNGRLSSSGKFRTNESDLEALIGAHLEEARRIWGKENGAVDVAIYAHGGLTSEESAARTAAEWIPALYDARIFPIFFMWETDLWSTLKNRLSDFLHGEPRPTGGFRDTLLKFWNRRLEQGLAPVGSMIWGEMKQNAEAISADEESGARKLHALSRTVAGFGPDRVRLHLIGHSAGSIVHCHLVRALAGEGWGFKTVNFMAPAVRLDTFLDTLYPQLEDGTVEHYNQFHLSDSAEQQDPTCRPILGYSRSLLYLVSNSFESGKPTRILGMEKGFRDLQRRRRGWRNLPIREWTAPGARTSSTTHGGFDNDPATRKTIIDLIRGRGV